MRLTFSVILKFKSRLHFNPDYNPDILITTSFTVHALESSPFFFFFCLLKVLLFLKYLLKHRHLKSVTQPWFFSHVQTNGWNLSVTIRHSCVLTGWGCGVETTHLMDEADNWRGGLEMRRRGEESDGWWLSEKWLRSSKSSFGYLCLPVDSPLFLPLLLSCSTPLFHLPHFSFNTLYLQLSNTHALFMAFGYPHLHHHPHPVFTTLLK